MNCTVNKYNTRPSVLPLGRIFDQFFADPAFGAAEETAFPVDIAENASHVVVRANLPGFSKDKIDVEVHEGVLSIRAARDEVPPDASERILRRERRTGTVARRFALPVEVAESGATAEFTDGVLTLRLPKSPKESPRKVAIQ